MMLRNRLEGGGTPRHTRWGVDSEYGVLRDVLIGPSDSSVMTPWGAIIMQLQKPYRRGEYAACLEFYLGAAIPIYDLVTAGNVEGGDFMVLKPGVVACGFSGERSIEPAVQQLKSWFEAEGWEFHAYAFDPHFLHLDVQMGMLAEGLAVVCVEAVEPELIDWLTARRIRVIAIPYSGGAVHCMSQALRRDDVRAD